MIFCAHYCVLNWLLPFCTQSHLRNQFESICSWIDDVDLWWCMCMPFASFCTYIHWRHWRCVYIISKQILPGIASCIEKQFQSMFDLWFLRQHTGNGSAQVPGAVHSRQGCAFGSRGSSFFEPTVAARIRMGRHWNELISASCFDHG